MDILGNTIKTTANNMEIVLFIKISFLSYDLYLGLWIKFFFSNLCRPATKLRNAWNKVVNQLTFIMISY